MVHQGQAEQRLAERQEVLDTAYALHPERFIRHAPRAGQLPEAVWINPPTTPVAAPGDAVDGERRGSAPTPAGSCPQPSGREQESVGALGCGQVEQAAEGVSAEP